jgi:DNA ligase (NAD+)
MDIDSLGEGKVEILYDHGLVKNAADLYSLQYDEILGLEKVIPAEGDKKERKLSLKEKSSRNIMDGIMASREIPFERVLFALGIRYVGETVARTLARYFKSIEALAASDLDTMKGIHEIGERIAVSVTTYFENNENLKLIQKLKDAGVQLSLQESDAAFPQILLGKSFVVSGTYEGYSRDQIKKMIEQFGGKNVSALSAKTHYLIAGANAGPSKLVKAEKQGITVINLKEFLEMLA